MNIGVDYYPEQWDKSLLQADADLMAKTGVKIVRVAEFAWSELEPQDGQFTFVLMTSEEVRIPRGGQKTYLHIEVKAEGFHRYDYNYTGFLEGSSMDEANIKEHNAVPLLSTTPYITIANFYGDNENVDVKHVENKGNKVEIQFLEGVTKANLILGTFTVEWKGKRPLEAGIYKAKVSITYSTP